MSNNSRLNRFLNGKGFYIALGICMITIGISAWTAIDKISTPPKTAESSNKAYTVSQETTSTPEAEVNKNESDVPDEREDVSSVNTSSKETISSDKDVSSNKSPVAKYFVYPVSGEIIKKFSDSELQYSVTYNDMRLHKGIDIKADAGCSVKSAGEGVVTEVVNDPELGYCVKIDHGNGIIGIYGGLTEAVAVEPETVVKSGTNLGPLGTVSNECLDAPHLHLEFTKDGKSVDPLTLLSK